MDGCAAKRSVDRLVGPRKATGLILRDNMNKTDGKTDPFCSRVGCSAKVTSTKRSRIGSTDNNTKVALPPVPSSSHGKEIVGSSSRTPGGFGYLRKPAKVTPRRKPSSSLDTESSEKTSIHYDPAATEPTLPRQKNKRGTINVHPQSAVSGEVVLTKAGSSSRGTSRSSHQKSELGTRDALTGPSVSTSSDNSEHTVRGGLSMNRLRNLRCNSVSDVLPTNSNSATKISVTKKKKNSDGESSSSSKGSKTSVLVPKVRSQISSHGNGITVSDNRRNRIVPSIRDSSVGSGGGRRSGYIGRSERLGAVASSATSRQMPHPATPTDPNPSLSFFPSDRYSRPNSSTGRVHSTMPGSPTEADPSNSLVNRDGLSHYNMNGIAEVVSVTILSDVIDMFLSGRESC